MRQSTGMRTILRRCLVLASAVISTHLGVGASAQGQMHVTQIEIAQLPQFCWGRYGVPNATGPEFNIPPGCGIAMNHYCDGLILLIRAEHAVRKGERLSLLGQAEQNIRYTESSIEGHPECPIRDHIAASRARVDELFRIYGGRPPKRQ